MCGWENGHHASGISIYNVVYHTLIEIQILAAFNFIATIGGVLNGIVNTSL